MFSVIIVVVSLIVYEMEGRTLDTENGVQLPCQITKYDLNGDSKVSMKEFLVVTQGFTRMEPKTLFQLLDRNANQILEIEEFKHVDPSLAQTNIFDHCKRLRCGCFCG